jgi:hypothetical protein
VPNGGVQEQVISAFPTLAPTARPGQSYMVRRRPRIPHAPPPPPRLVRALGPTSEPRQVVWNQMVGGMADGTKYGAWDAASAKERGVASGTMAGPMVFWGEAAGAQVRKTPSCPRNWANFSLLSLYSHGDAWANSHLLGQPNALLAIGRLGAGAHPGDASSPGR